MDNKKVEIFPGCFDWSEELLDELAGNYKWELVAGFLDIECAHRLVSENYYKERQGHQLFVKELPDIWMQRLRELIEKLTGYTGQLMQPRIVVYRNGEEFKEHADHPTLRDGYMRTQSFCAYLTTPESGGELFFNHGIVIRPKAGLVATFDPRFIHASLPVKGSEAKIVIVTWFVEEDEHADMETVTMNHKDLVQEGS